VPSLGAFVIFSKFQDVEKLNKTFKQLHKNSIRNCFGCCRKVWPEKHYFLGKYKLKIDIDSDEPSNVNWENLDIHPLEQGIRKFINFVFLTLFVLFTLSILVTNKAATKSQSSSCNKITFKRSDLPSIKKGYSSFKYCFCQKVAYTSSDAEMYVFCNSFSSNVYLTYALKVIGSLVIVLVNKITGWFNKKMIKFTRYKTVSEENS